MINILASKATRFCPHLQIPTCHAICLRLPVRPSSRFRQCPSRQLARHFSFCLSPSSSSSRSFLPPSIRRPPRSALPSFLILCPSAIRSILCRNPLCTARAAAAARKRIGGDKVKSQSSQSRTIKSAILGTHREGWWTNSFPHIDLRSPSPVVS